MSEIWPAIVASVLSAASFAVAIALGLRLADLRGWEARRTSESRAALAAAVAVVLLIVAIVFWSAYLIFGPVRDYVVEIVGRD